MVEWLDEQVILVLGGRPTLMALDMFGGHKTGEVLDNMHTHDITLSVIPGGCTGLVQPLDISINQLFKDILKIVSPKRSQERGREELIRLITDFTDRAGSAGRED